MQLRRAFGSGAHRPVWGGWPTSGYGLHEYRLFFRFLMQPIPRRIFLATGSHPARYSDGGFDMEYFLGVMRWSILVTAVLACWAVAQVGIVGF